VPWQPRVCSICGFDAVIIFRRSCEFTKAIFLAVENEPDATDEFIKLAFTENVANMFTKLLAPGTNVFKKRFEAFFKMFFAVVLKNSGGSLHMLKLKKQLLDEMKALVLRFNFFACGPFMNDSFATCMLLTV